LEPGDGGDYTTTLTIGDNEVYTDKRSLLPGQLFDTSNDGAPECVRGSTLINGNEHAQRDITSDIVDVEGFARFVAGGLPSARLATMPEPVLVQITAVGAF
jgi:hypothetical protein